MDDCAASAYFPERLHGARSQGRRQRRLHGPDADRPLHALEAREALEALEAREALEALEAREAREALNACRTFKPV